MTPRDYDRILREKGFIFLRSQEAWTQHRGLESVYTHPKYKHQFYIKRVSDDVNSPFGLNAQKANGKILDKLYPHNAVDTFRDKGLFMWVDDAFIELMERI